MIPRTCYACKLEVHPEATVCPHCHEPQGAYAHVKGVLALIQIFAACALIWWAWDWYAEYSAAIKAFTK